jgi:hypothetical protein
MIKESTGAQQVSDGPGEDFKHVVDVEQFRKLGYEVGSWGRMQTTFCRALVVSRHP